MDYQVRFRLLSLVIIVHNYLKILIIVNDYNLLLAMCGSFTDTILNKECNHVVLGFS